MSTIKVSNIQNASASSAAITLDANGQATLNGLNYPTAGPLSNRNLIINGAMQVAQRGTSETGVTGNGYKQAPDRFRVAMGSLGTFTVSQSTEAPAGFSNSYKWECTTADASPTANGNVTLVQSIEAQNLQHLKMGTADAEAVTLSFWVRSNKTGTYIVQIEANDSGRSISKSYTIDAADTWEYKTITYEGDTTGEINNDNGVGFHVYFWLAAGSTFTSGTLATSWETTTNANRAVGQVNLADSTSNEWYITGVQLEVGSVATPFEHRSYGDELARCQRYCQTLGGAEYNQIRLGAYKNAARVEGAIKHVVQMRTGPSVTTTGSGDFTADKGGSTFATDLAFQSVITAETNQDVTFVDVSPSTSVSGSDGQCGFLYNNASSTRKLILSAEL